MPPDDTRTEIPPEIAALSKDEFRAIYEQATLIVLGITQSKTRTDELMQAASVLLLTTRRWDRDKGPLLKHLVGIARSVLSHSYRREKTDRADRAAQDRESFQREVIGTEARSAEDDTVDRTDADERQVAAARELDELDASLPEGSDAQRVLRCRRAGEKRKKPAEIAHELGLPVERVYRANKLLLHHVRRIRAARAGEGPVALHSVRKGIIDEDEVSS
jgi:DNA-directed RNA polymerase specialized sigma24 family protein